MSYKSFYCSFIQECSVCLQLSYLKRPPAHFWSFWKITFCCKQWQAARFFSFPLKFDRPGFELRPLTIVRVVSNWASDRHRPGRDSSFWYFSTKNNNVSDVCSDVFVASRISTFRLECSGIFRPAGIWICKISHAECVVPAVVVGGSASSVGNGM